MLFIAKELLCYSVIAITSFLILQYNIPYIMTQYFRGVDVFWEHFKKSTSIIKTRLNFKATFASPIHNNIKRKTIFATICILTLLALITFIEDFEPVKSIVKADSVVGIGVGIYWDNDCTNITHSLNWGFIDPNSNNNLTVYVRNEANSVVSLGLITANWILSSAPNYIFLTWNYSGQNLKPNEVIPIKLTLTVSPTIIDVTDFSLETTITIFDKP
jgi:hypothetical protein